MSQVRYPGFGLVMLLLVWGSGMLVACSPPAEQIMPDEAGLLIENGEVVRIEIAADAVYLILEDDREVFFKKDPEIRDVMMIFTAINLDVWDVAEIPIVPRE